MSWTTSASAVTKYFLWLDKHLTISQKFEHVSASGTKYISSPSTAAKQVCGLRLFTVGRAFTISSVGLLVKARDGILILVCSSFDSCIMLFVSFHSDYRFFTAYIRYLPTKFRERPSTVLQDKLSDISYSKQTASRLHYLLPSTSIDFIR